MKTKRTRKRALSLIAALAFIVSMAASVGMDTYYTALDDPVATSVRVKKIRI